MTSDEYLRYVLTQHVLPAAPGSAALAKQTIEPLIKGLAGRFLLGFDYSGSIAKGTGIKASTDVDFFISLDPQTPHDLGDIYKKLGEYFQGNGYVIRKQNVSIGITVNNLSVDLVPGRKHPGYTNDHSLFRSKANTWTQTNVATHIKTVAESGRLEEIRALKIWRKLHSLNFPSFYLEMSAIYALYRKPFGQPADNFWALLQYLSTDWINASIIDPANTNNRLSDDLSSIEKRAVAASAAMSLSRSNWSQILW